MKPSDCAWCGKRITVEDATTIRHQAIERMDLPFGVAHLPITHISHRKCYDEKHVDGGYPVVRRIKHA